MKSGALVFVQWFGSALQLTPHFHVLLPEALWTRMGERVPVPSPKEGYETLQVEAIQEKLPFAGEEIELPKTRKPMVAVREGLQKIIRYAARGLVSEKRVKLLEDGRTPYKTKRGRC